MSEQSNLLERSGLAAPIGSAAGADSDEDRPPELGKSKSTSSDSVPPMGTSLRFGTAVRLRVFWTTTFGMLCAMWTYPAVLEQLQPALVAEGLPATEAVSLVSAVAVCGICGKLASGTYSCS